MARVLVIDDSRLARVALRRALERGDHVVQEADDAEKGLLALRGGGFDLVTCDMLMPGMSGVEFLAAVREAGIDVPVIVVTADIQKTTREECLQNGAWTVLPKPVSDEELTTQVASAMSARASQGRALTPAQKDALTEVVNVGAGRAAAALNNLIEGHVTLKVPQVELLTIDSVGTALKSLARESVASVQMGFKGSLDGSAFLVFPHQSAVKLVEIVAGADSALVDLDDIQASTLTEVGNIVISGVMGTLASLLNKAVRYSLPVYEQHPDVELLASRRAQNPLILLAKTSFTIRRAVTIEGHLLLLFELNSLDSLLSILQHGPEIS